MKAKGSALLRYYSPYANEARDGCVEAIPLDVQPRIPLGQVVYADAIPNFDIVTRIIRRYQMQLTLSRQAQVLTHLDSAAPVVEVVVGLQEFSARNALHLCDAIASVALLDVIGRGAFLRHALRRPALCHRS